MPTPVQPAWRLRLRLSQSKSAERDCCKYCPCLFHVFTSLRRMISPLLTIDRGPHAAVTKKSDQPNHRRLPRHSFMRRLGGIPGRNLELTSTRSIDSEPAFARDDTFL